MKEKKTLEELIQDYNECKEINDGGGNIYGINGI